MGVRKVLLDLLFEIFSYQCTKTCLFFYLKGDNEVRSRAITWIMPVEFPYFAGGAKHDEIVEIMLLPILYKQMLKIRKSASKRSFLPRA